MLSNKQINDYLADSGMCPYCRSRHLDGDEIEFIGDAHYQKISCDNCGKEWTDVYTLSKIVEEEQQ